MNYGGSRKTTSKAYANIGGTRKQIYPYNYTYVYQYRRYTVNSWTTKTMSASGYVSGLSMSSCYTSYSFSSGTFSLSGSGSNYFEEYENQLNGSTEYAATRTLYAKLSSRVIVVVDSFQTGDYYDGVEGMVESAIYAYPNGYGGSYTTITENSPRSTGYAYGYEYTYDSGTGDTSTEIPKYTGYYYQAI